MRLPQADVPSSDTATLLTDGRVLVTMGCSTAAELYDPATGTFSPTGSLTATRGGETATLLQDGRVLITGGDNCGDAEHAGIWASAELYDPATGTFSPTGSMGTPRACHTATLLADGRVLITGRHHGAEPARLPCRSCSPRTRTAITAETVPNVLASAELYDPATGTFSPTGSMSVFRDRHTATLLQDGRVLVVGGGGEGYASRTSAELYDPATGTFSRTGSMKNGRWLHTATLLAGRPRPHRRRPVAQGLDLRHAPSSTTPDPARSASTGSMKASRQQHTATLLQDGRVLIAGGYQQDGPLGRALLDGAVRPGDRDVHPDRLDGRRARGHTATLLNDGRVLIAGGSGIGHEAGFHLGRPVPAVGFRLFVAPQGSVGSHAPRVGGKRPDEEPAPRDAGRGDRLAGAGCGGAATTAPTVPTPTAVPTAAAATGTPRALATLAPTPAPSRHLGRRSPAPDDRRARR